MEVVCLIFAPMLASQPCSDAFWVLTSLHLLSFLLNMFFIILVNNKVCCCQNNNVVQWRAQGGAWGGVRPPKFD